MDELYHTKAKPTNLVGAEAYDDTSGGVGGLDGVGGVGGVDGVEDVGAVLILQLPVGIRS